MGFDGTINKDTSIKVRDLLDKLPQIQEGRFSYLQSHGFFSSRVFQDERDLELALGSGKNLFEIFPEFLVNHMFRRFPIIACYFGNSPLYTFKGAENYSCNVRMACQDFFPEDRVILPKRQFMHPMYKGLV